MVGNEDVLDKKVIKLSWYLFYPPQNVSLFITHSKKAKKKERKQIKKSYQ